MTVARRAHTHAQEQVPGLAEAAARSPKGSLLANLRELTTERNRWAHGSAPRTCVEAAQRLTRLVPLLEAALTHAGFLLDLPWVVTRSSSYLARERSLDVSVSYAMADHPEFERKWLRSEEPHADGRLYLMLDRRRLVDLTPFVVRRNCEVCNQSELFYADKLLRSSSTVLKSFGGGHPMSDGTLDEDIRLLGGAPGVDLLP